MRTAFVLSGGAALGAVQVGMLQALHAHGVRPDLIVGTSAGAINGGWIAQPGGYDDLDGLAEVWRGLDRKMVFPVSWIRVAKGLTGRADHMVSSAALHNMIKRHVSFERFDQAEVEFHVIAADVLEGRDHRFSTGSVRDAIVASASIPGVLPPVEIDGKLYVDGGTVNNTPLTHGMQLGADRIWVIPNAFACGTTTAPGSALGMALHAVSLLVNRRLARDVERLRDSVDLRVIPPPCPVDVSALDFAHGAELIEAGRWTTEAWLATLDLDAEIGRPDEDVAGPASVEPGRRALDPDIAEPLNPGIF